MFLLVASRRGAYWQLSEPEKREVGDKLANVLQHVPLPERELGIAADVAALGFVFAAITMPRLNHERELVAARDPRAAGTVPPPPVAPAFDGQAPPPPPPPPPADANATIHDLGEGTPSPLDALDATIRDAFPDGLNLHDPAHVERLNAIAASQADETASS